MNLFCINNLFFNIFIRIIFYVYLLLLILFEYKGKHTKFDI